LVAEVVDDEPDYKYNGFVSTVSAFAKCDEKGKGKGKGRQIFLSNFGPIEGATS
tara:strand:+ start:716 stop:877 length:162 start_codon:yes stop_codon:yes gene_type:complete